MTITYDFYYLHTFVLVPEMYSTYTNTEIETRSLQDRIYSAEYIFSIVISPRILINWKVYCCRILHEKEKREP